MNEICQPVFDKTGQQVQSVGHLKAVVCGSVDDGKSTLIGRMLYDLGKVPDDVLAKMHKESGDEFKQANTLDFSLACDGLLDEREQGITIDVCYRYLSTHSRSYVLIDAPGHEQYTRNMATAASQAHIALVMVDVTKGVSQQTKRHIAICHGLGVTDMVLCINKIDAKEYDGLVFASIKKELEEYTAQFSHLTTEYLPISSLCGDNVVFKSTRMPWYTGATLVEIIDHFKISHKTLPSGFCLPIQYVRKKSNQRLYYGTLLWGQIRQGEAVSVAGGIANKIKKIYCNQKQVDQADQGQSVSFLLEKETDVVRGDILTSVVKVPTRSDQLQVKVLWVSDQQNLLPNRTYAFKFIHRIIHGCVTKIKKVSYMNNVVADDAQDIGCNMFAICNIFLNEKVDFLPFNMHSEMGSCIVIDRHSKNTVGVATIRHSLSRADNIHPTKIEVGREQRASQKQQNPKVFWLTGLSGAGKSTLAQHLDQQIFAQGGHAYVLDGDNVRQGLCRDLGFTEADRAENIRRLAYLAKYLHEAGLFVIVAAISPFSEDREMAKNIIGGDQFLEVFVDASLELCKHRDAKGLYDKYNNEKIRNFTGLSSPYQEPKNPDVHLKTGEMSIEDCVGQLLELTVCE